MKKGISIWMLLMVFAVGFTACSEDDPVEEIAVDEKGIIGNWEATDISAILTNLGYDDMLYANFKEDQTYEVKSYIAGVEYKLVGTFTQKKDAATGLWEITLNQTSMNGAPSEITSKGIFEIKKTTPVSLWYEVAQTNPEISGVFPPTAEAGFGSTSGGAWGETNIQKYVKTTE
ncbi:hypothetical protein [Carboxylicivirga taeanensis]|uniref:hypothetical protein n=1 Tax=Carboxylicivirga taeanensis TaxID=1416875 RepID=UPI003F6E353A